MLGWSGRKIGVHHIAYASCYRIKKHMETSMPGGLRLRCPDATLAYWRARLAYPSKFYMVQDTIFIDGSTL